MKAPVAGRLALAVGSRVLPWRYYHGLYDT